MFYKLVEEYSDIIKNYWVFDLKKYGSAFSLLATLEFTDQSRLHIKDYLFDDGKRKYSYHWQSAKGELISRWDNSPHHQEIATFPHHKHLPDKILMSQSRNLREILKVISGEMPVPKQVTNQKIRSGD